jgi:hypothetical protein
LMPFSRALCNTSAGVVLLFVASVTAMLPLLESVIHSE